MANEPLNPTTDPDVLNFEEIKEARDLTFEDVDVPEWGVGKKIRLQVLSAKEAIEFSKAMRDPAKKDDAIVRIVALCAVNRDGTRMIQGDAAMTIFKGKSIVVFNRLQKKCLVMNGFVDAEGNTPDVKKLEEETKNV
jgi:hypothetical protein